MRVKARKVGNSITVTIPRELVTEMDITEDTDMDIFVREGVVVIEPVLSRWDRLVERVRAQAAESGAGEADVDAEMAAIRQREPGQGEYPRGGSKRR